MKKSILLPSVLILQIAICNLQSVIVNAQTSIPAGTVSGTWTLAGSPYNIQGAIQIPNGDSLIIQPGVSVVFHDTYKLAVQGKLKAIGTVTGTIIFTAADTANGWRGIRFDNTPATNDTSKIKYCKLIYGKATGTSPDDNGGAFYFNTFSKVIISNCRTSDCIALRAGGAICSYNSNLTISNNTISKNQLWRWNLLQYSSNPTIESNIISNNSATNAGLNHGGGGIECDNNSNTDISNNIISNNSVPHAVWDNHGGGINCISSNPVITNNTISNNSATQGFGDGICCNSGSPTISNNTISNNSASRGGGIICSGDTTISNNTISNNTATGALSYEGGGGIYCSGISSIITNNTIANNTAANGGALFCDNSSNPTLYNCILCGNTASTSGAQVYLDDEASDPNFYYCDVQCGTAAFGLNGIFFAGTYSNNIDADPKFVSPSGGSCTGFNGVTADWSLQNTSPCIDVQAIRHTALIL